MELYFFRSWWCAVTWERCGSWFAFARACELFQIWREYRCELAGAALGGAGVAVSSIWAAVCSVAVTNTGDENKHRNENGSCKNRRPLGDDPGAVQRELTSDSTVSDLRKAIEEKTEVSVPQQTLSFAAGPGQVAGPFSFPESARLVDCAVSNGTMLKLETKVTKATAAASGLYAAKKPDEDKSAANKPASAPAQQSSAASSSTAGNSALPASATGTGSFAPKPTAAASSSSSAPGKQEATSTTDTDMNGEPKKPRSSHSTSFSSLGGGIRAHCPLSASTRRCFSKLENKSRSPKASHSSTRPGATSTMSPG